MKKTRKACFLMPMIAIITSVFIVGTSVCMALQEQPFTDVNEDDWFFSDVHYVYGEKLMNGISETTFAPNDSTTRGMIVTILWRLNGETESVSENPFLDVENDSYYYDAVVWASENGIVSGYDDTTFGPQDYITREQLATILYRYAEYKELSVDNEADISSYDDFGEISDYAIKAMRWANAKGIINGIDSDTISPKGNATRCQVAAILKRICENILGKDEVPESKEDIITEKEEPEQIEKPSLDLNEDVSGPSDNPSVNEDEGFGDVIYEPEPKQAVLKLNNAYGKPGETVEVTLDLQENPGILGMILSLEYDETALRLVKAINGEAVSEVLTLTSSQTLESGTRFVWDGLEISKAEVKTGTLLTLRFEVLNDAVIGKRYPLRIDSASGDIVDVELNPVLPTIYQGYIEIEDVEIE